MAFNNNLGKQSFISTSGQSRFDFNFKIFSDTDLKVYVTPVGQKPEDEKDIKVLNSDYFVTIDGDDGGYIEFVEGLALDSTVVLLRDLPRVRDTQYVTNGDLFATTINIDQDYQTYLIMDNYVNTQSAIRLPESSVNIGTQLPDVDADSYLKWNSEGTALENDTTIPENVVLSQEAAVSALKSKEEAAASSSNADNASATAVNAATSALQSAESSKASENIAVSAATSASNSETNAKTSETNAKTSETNAKTSATQAKTSETNAAESAEDAQINEWGAEADARTAESYATEPEDVFVKIWKSNGDGTFSYDNSTDYSALHYAEKAAAGVSVDWGNIQGDITAQTDLNNALNGKASKQGDTTVTFKAANGVASNDVVNVSQVFGVGQSYVNYGTTKKLNTNYVNTTGKPIQIYVYASASNTGLTASVNGITVFIDVYRTNGTVSGNVIIPNGATYKIIYSGTLQRWDELR